MLKPLSTLLVVFVMLFAFAEQSFAYHQPFESHVQSNNSTQTSQSSTSHAVSNVDNEEACCDVPCCELGCVCPANSCMFSLYLPMASCSTNVVLQNNPAVNYIVKPPILITTRLFKPPIFIS
ncbi:hypothetical protein PSECIP111951_03484 [Pseudoalteromonas holothuriae]|uniref:Uncharacterized protein n=1 Tax=Pseudoalteromonas holothuriae TaxID=2963714 RepID=A0A9W4QZF4_9GAMM|nr:hypothetical protein [Pseudoalteromonas sp. CIP111951]CAH9060342.1 hypothetical protein PSECIP111854_02586 [Pseudoalteromonas sp. CIP111854]CAH9066015.1 hypothetical protein PSECIP111951_03484 [Pseudoalteromonas sp. CIP111951]